MRRLDARKWLGLLVSLTGLVAAQVRAFDYLVANWGSEQGLPHSMVNSIAQTRDGYLWLATYVGLVRFDGIKFVHYSSSEMPELGSGRVWKLFEDRDGVLWISLESGGLLAYKDGQARTYLADGALPEATTAAMAQDAAGTIWLQTSDSQLGRLTNGGVEFVANSGAVPSRANLGLAVDGQNNLWVGTSDGLKVWQQGRLVTPPGMEPLEGGTVDAMAPARDGSVWVFRNHRLRKVRQGGIVADLPGPAGMTGSAVQMLETSDHCLWLAAHDGNLFYLTPALEWQAIPPQAGLRGHNRSLYEDREGNVWRGSVGGGLARLRPKFFTSYVLSSTIELDRYAMSLCSDEGGNVWGVFNFSTNHALARISAGAAMPQPLPNPDLSQPVQTLWHDRRDCLWAGTERGAVYRLRDGAFVRELQVDTNGEPVNAFFEDATSNLWVGCVHGVGVMPQGDPARWHLIPGVPFPDVRAIAQAVDGAMWFGTRYGGASRRENGRWTRFTTRDGLTSDYVRCLRADADGTVWLGTMHGLCWWRDGKFASVTSENGLWNDSISHMDEDSHGNLWLSSFGGIFRVRRADLMEYAAKRRTFIQCVGYNRNDGLPSLECTGSFQPAGTKTPDGRLWFPTVSGVVSVAPEQIPENGLAPPVALEDAIIDGVRRPALSLAPVLEVGPGLRQLEFQFTALSLVAPEKVRFRHQLEGLDHGWSMPDEHRSTAYSYLPPGHYTFRVTACNNDGVWNRDGASLGLIVRPFLWQTWWFKVGLGLCLALAPAWGVWRLERWKSRLRVEQGRALERERVRIAKDIHDDLGASLTQIAFLSEQAEPECETPGEVDRSHNRIAAIAHRTIQSLEETVWAISPKHDSLESLANYLTRFVQEHLELAKVRCVLDVPTILPEIQVTPEVRHNLALAVREAVQNVVAHAAATEVRASLHLGEEVLEITITDNGRGFKVEEAAEGNGLFNMRRRLEDLGGQLDVSSAPGGGTSVRFRVPRDRLNRRPPESK
jgi:signal transduction histidine kinase/ligand-binding sensor domain-containing protein